MHKPMYGKLWRPLGGLRMTPLALLAMLWWAWYIGTQHPGTQHPGTWWQGGTWAAGWAAGIWLGRWAADVVCWRHLYTGAATEAVARVQVWAASNPKGRLRAVQWRGATAVYARRATPLARRAGTGVAVDALPPRQ